MSELKSLSESSPATNAIAANGTNTTTQGGTTAVLSVEQLNRQIRQLLEGELSQVWVQGEISNFKAHTSGHFYFSLKDPKSQISAVMFRGHNSRLRFKPSDGLEVIVRGKVTVYEPRGNYQIMVEMMEPVGAGALQKAFEQLKDKLKKEGLFDSARKRAIPALPRHVAIVTSPTGAAIRDMLNVLGRRNRSVQVTLIPTIVQGEGSASQICDAMKKALRLPNVDVIIVGRGGGSIEDLWAFNDENLARTIAASPIPVISAVGHEIDFTISDFVADLRAPTPSAAAELVAKSSADLVLRLQTLERMLRVDIAKVLKLLNQKCQGLSVRLVDPKRKLQDLIFRNDELTMRLQQSTSSYFEHRRLELNVLERRIISPMQVLNAKIKQVQIVEIRLKSNIAKILESRKSSLARLMAMIESLSPLKVVERGYSVTKKQNKLVKKSSQLKVGDEIEVKLMEGQILAEVKKVLE